MSIGPLRGRQNELADLERLVASAAGGEGGLALVEGPPGIGKSRLLEEAARLAAGRGLVVATGRADELDQMTPWGPLVRALSSTDPAIVSPGQFTSVSGLLDGRLEVLERFRAALESAGGRQPLLIVIDDIHWADPSTLMALGSLAVQLFSYPVVWLLSRRPFPASGQMNALLDRLAAQDILRLPLAPLDAQATAALATDLLGRSLGRELDGLVAQAQGNPLYVVEILRNAGGPRDGADVPFSGRDARVARSLASVVVNHLRSLSEAARRLIKVASVLGPTFSVVELSTITGQPASELMEPLEEALAADVLVNRGAQLAFRHDLFRQAVYGDIPSALRLAMHRDAASALQALGVPVVRIATHLAIGALPGDESAVETLGQAVFELFGTSPTAAADLALRIIELVGPDDPRQPVFVSMAVQMLGWAGRLGEARALGEAYIADRDPPLELEAQIQEGIRRAWAMSTALPYPTPLREGLTTGSSVPASVRASLIAFDSFGATLDKTPGELDQAFRHAVGLVAGSGDGTDMAVVQATRVTLASEHGRMLDALEIAESPLEAGADGPSERAAGLHDMMIARVLSAVGRPAEALEAAARALDAATSSGFTTIVSGCQAQRATALLELGRLEDARAEADSATEIAESLGFGYWLSMALVTIVETAIRQGDLAEAKASFDRLLAHSPDEPTGDAWWAAALCADAEGRHGAATEALAPMFERLGRLRFQSVAWCPSRLPQLVGLALRSGDRDQAAIAVRASTELARRNPDSLTLAASATHAAGILDSDCSPLRDAVQMLAQGERPLAIAAAREDLARSTAKDEAVEQLEAAYETYVRSGARRDTARVRAALRAFGVRKRQTSVARSGHGWESLTTSERAVVDLVARGLTNREAAGELFLSPYTINVHLRHAFTKLDVRSRVQLARFVAERERVPT